MADLAQILRPNVLSRLVSRQMVAEQWILGFMGFEVGGRNELDDGHGREGSYDVFNNTREVGEGRIPDSAASIVRPNPVGVVRYDYPRLYEQLSLSSEKLHNLRQIGVNGGVRDVGGTVHKRLQTQYIAQRGANWRAALTLGMLRDSLYLTKDGDSLYPTFTSAGSTFQINFQTPAGNKSQLDMLGDGDIIDVSWDNSSANIPKHLDQINAAFEELSGSTLMNVILTGEMWQNVINNDKVASQAGIANAPFTRFERQVGTRSDGSPLNVAVGELACRPGVTFYITDSGVKLGAPGSQTFTKYVEDTGAIFMGSPNSGNFHMMLGSEPVAEFDGDNEVARTGRYMWSTQTANPARTNIFSLDNALAGNDIPNSVAYGTVVF